MNKLDLEIIILFSSKGELLKKPEKSKRCLLPVPDVAINVVVPHLQSNTKHRTRKRDPEGGN